MKLLIIFGNVRGKNVVNLRETHKLMKSDHNEPVIQINNRYTTKTNYHNHYEEQGFYPLFFK